MFMLLDMAQGNDVLPIQGSRCSQLGTLRDERIPSTWCTPYM